MICPNCGREIPDGTVCPCTQQQNAPAYAVSEAPAIGVMKSVGSSPVFLTATILMSVAALLSIIASAVAASKIQNAINYYNYYGYNPYASSSAIRSIYAVSGVSVANILIVVGMWLAYGAARNRQPGPFKTAGLTMCRVIMILELVGVYFVGAILFLMGIVFIVQPYELMEKAMEVFQRELDFEQLFRVLSRFGPEAQEIFYSARSFFTFIGIMFIVIAAIVVPLAAGYLHGLSRFLKRAKYTAATGMPDDRISMYVIVMNYIAGAGTAISALSTMESDVLSGVSGLCQAAVPILMSICLNNYRRGMASLIRPVQGYYGGQSGYPQPQVPYQQAQPYQQPQAPYRQPQPYQQPPQTAYWQPPQAQPQAPVYQPVQPVQPQAPAYQPPVERPAAPAEPPAFSKADTQPIPDLTVPAAPAEPASFEPVISATEVLSPVEPAIPTVEEPASFEPVISATEVLSPVEPAIPTVEEPASFEPVISATEVLSPVEPVTLSLEEPTPFEPVIPAAEEPAPVDEFAVPPQEPAAPAEDPAPTDWPTE